MLGPYEAVKERQIRYKGNKVFQPIADICDKLPDSTELEQRVTSLHDKEIWPAISRINNQINKSVNEYFNYIGALFVPLPLTTRMISSPGAVYGKETINYTTDTCPITLKWFDLPDQAFLVESAQIYLELALLQKGVNQVWANYNSFRKEFSDSTHLSEFHHIEYEGKINQIKNTKIIQDLLFKIVNNLINNNSDDLCVFLEQNKISELEEMTKRNIPVISLRKALNLLYEDTKNEVYKNFSLQNFHTWEEVRLTQIVGGIVGVSEMPLLEVPFYHSNKPNSNPSVANNTDIIWPGYRETVGSGHRVRSLAELEEKASIFNLPREDYQPYIQSRKFSDYQETSGFGLGWERLLHGLLEMPFIHTASLFPRVHSTLKP